MMRVVCSLTTVYIPFLRSSPRRSKISDMHSPFVGSPCGPLTRQSKHRVGAADYCPCIRCSALQAILPDRHRGTRLQP